MIREIEIITREREDLFIVERSTFDREGNNIGNLVKVVPHENKGFSEGFMKTLMGMSINQKWQIKKVLWD